MEGDFEIVIPEGTENVEDFKDKQTKIYEGKGMKVAFVPFNNETPKDPPPDENKIDEPSKTDEPLVDLPYFKKLNPEIEKEEDFENHYKTIKEIHDKYIPLEKEYNELKVKHSEIAKTLSELQDPWEGDEEGFKLHEIVKKKGKEFKPIYSEILNNNIDEISDDKMLIFGKKLKGSKTDNDTIQYGIEKEYDSDPDNIIHKLSRGIETSYEDCTDEDLKAKVDKEIKYNQMLKKEKADEIRSEIKTELEGIKKREILNTEAQKKIYQEREKIISPEVDKYLSEDHKIPLSDGSEEFEFVITKDMMKPYAEYLKSGMIKANSNEEFQTVKDGFLRDVMLSVQPQVLQHRIKQVLEKVQDEYSIVIGEKFYGIKPKKEPSETKVKTVDKYEKAAEEAEQRILNRGSGKR